jgi:2-oxoglutarate ferredoxin oxidoreductase subunit beta
MVQYLLTASRTQTAHTQDATSAFALSRLTHSDHEPTPMGIFRDVERDEYGAAVSAQIARVQQSKGQGDLAKLLRSNGSWTVQ